MNKSFLTFAIAIAFSANSIAQTSEKLVSKIGHVNFFSHTPIEDITANNYTVTSTLDTTSGMLVYVVPMQGFEFEKALMQKHYNSPKFLDTKKFPKSKFKGVITNLNDIDFTKNGTYTAAVKGKLTIHGVTKPITEKATITVTNDGIEVTTKMHITLSDYNIAFKKGKPSTNIAKTLLIKATSKYTK